MSALRDALTHGDRAGAERLAHSLKGVAGPLGASGLAEAATELVAAIRAGEGETRIDALAQRVEAVQRQLAADLARLDDSAIGQPAQP